MLPTCLAKLKTIFFFFFIFSSSSCSSSSANQAAFCSQSPALEASSSSSAAARHSALRFAQQSTSQRNLASLFAHSRTRTCTRRLRAASSSKQQDSANRFQATSSHRAGMSTAIEARVRAHAASEHGRVCLLGTAYLGASSSSSVASSSSSSSPRHMSRLADCFSSWISHSYLYELQCK